MVGVTNSYYGLTDLQNIADYVKFRLFGTIVATGTEATAYDPLLVNFLGKLVTLQFIPAAVDYWGDQLVQESTSGTNESVTFPDRREGLWKVFDDIRSEVQGEYNQMAETYGFKIYGQLGVTPAVSYGDNGTGVLVTPDPNLFAQGWEPPLPDLGLIWTRG
jgi:hypothetical protein